RNIFPSNATRSGNVPPTSTPICKRVCSPVEPGIRFTPMRRLFLAATLALSLCIAIPACNSHPHDHVGAASAAVSPRGETPAAKAAPTVADAKSTLTYLASDELEGRGVGTHGLDLAADYVAAQFTAPGLRTIPGQRD